MIEKVPALLYEQFMQGDLDAKDEQMVGESFQYGTVLIYKTNRF